MPPVQSSVRTVCMAARVQVETGDDGKGVEEKGSGKKDTASKR